ncbi:MAG: lysophospholipid acyltransferase family protein [Verrucomicrobiota bacterium]|nr:lysophospholipid acyltransferase family protein [Verrucomicrobiota bacterium]
MIRLFARLHFKGREHLPCQGGVVLIGNHISHFDPFIEGGALSRPVEYLTMSELFVNPLSRAFFLANGAISINRFGVDRKAVKTALERLRAGRVIGIYPEKGLRSGAESFLGGAPFPEGAASLAIMADVPVVPMVIIGSDKIYAPRLGVRSDVYIHYGPPLFPAHKDKLAFQTEVFLALKCLYADMIATYHLNECDLPHTAQFRKGKRPANQESSTDETQK